jgi:integrase
MSKEQPRGLKHVGECLYRHHAGTYYALVKVSGKQIKRSLKTADLALAKRRIADFRNSASRLTGSEKSLIFEGLVTRWLASIQPQMKDSSYQRRVTSMNQVKPFFNGHLVKSIGLREIEHWKTARAAKLAARTYNIEVETLRQVFEYAREDLRIILENPAAKLKRRKESRHRPEIPTKVQFIQLLTEMKAEPKSVEGAKLVEFLAYSGLRVGEAVSVCWSDVDFKTGTLTVTGGDKGTKNHEFRVIPLFSPLEKFLKRPETNRYRFSQDGGISPDTIALRSATESFKRSPSSSGCVNRRSSIFHFRGKIAERGEKDGSDPIFKK